MLQFESVLSFQIGQLSKRISPSDLELQPPHWLPSLVSFGIKRSWKAHGGYRKMAADDRSDIKSVSENSKLIVGFFHCLI